MVFLFADRDLHFSPVGGRSSVLCRVLHSQKCLVIVESDYTVTLPPLFIKSEPEPLTVQEDVKHADTKNLHSAQSTVRGLRHLQPSWISEKHQQGGSM